MVVFLQSDCIRANVVVFWKSGCIPKKCLYWDKAVVFGQSGSFPAKVVVFVKSGCTPTRVVVIG